MIPHKHLKNAGKKKGRGRNKRKRGKFLLSLALSGNDARDTLMLMGWRMRPRALKTDKSEFGAKIVII